LVNVSHDVISKIETGDAPLGAHAGLLGAFIIADLDGSPGMVYLETAAEGYDTDSPAVVAQAVLRFDDLRSEALPRAASRELILKVAGERWT
jgi:hypothetical protein